MAPGQTAAFPWRIEVEQDELPRPNDSGHCSGPVLRTERLCPERSITRRVGREGATAQAGRGATAARSAGHRRRIHPLPRGEPAYPAHRRGCRNKRVPARRSLAHHSRRPAVGMGGLRAERHHHPDQPAARRAQGAGRGGGSRGESPYFTDRDVPVPGEEMSSTTTSQRGSTMKRTSKLKIATAAVVLAVLGGTAVYAQDKYSLKSPSGI